MKTQLLYKGAALAIAALLLSSTSVFADKRVKAGNGPIMLHINNQTNNNYILRGTANMKAFKQGDQGKILAQIPAHQTTVVEGIEIVSPYPGAGDVLQSGHLSLNNTATGKIENLGSFLAEEPQNNNTNFMYQGLHDEKSDTHLEVPTTDFARTAFVVNIKLYEEASQLNATVDVTSTGS